MLSSFFSKSKPINFIVIAFYMITMYSIAYIRKGFEVSYSTVLLFLGGIGIYIISMLLINTTTQKNDLTHGNTYTILLFAFFTAILPKALTRPEILLANLFLIIGLKWVMDMRNGKSIKGKILNASLCIGLASVSYGWSIGFIMIVFLGIAYFVPNNYRNWCIPIIGLLIVYIFATCFTLLFFNSFYYIHPYQQDISFVFEKYFLKDHLFSIGTLFICILLFLSVYTVKFHRKSTKSKPILKLIIAHLLVAILLVFTVDEKDTAEMIFIATPLAMIGTTYLEIEHLPIVKEINIWVLLLLPFLPLLF